MKKTAALYSIIFFTLAGAINSCSKESNLIYFSINSHDYRVNIPVCLQDSIIADMIFDTGAVDGVFRLDSAFVAAHPSLVSGTHPVSSGKLGSAWTVYDVPSLHYDTTINVKLGQTSISYDNLHIYNMRKALAIDFSDGIFNMPKNDTSHVWEWNFEHNYLEIHSTEDFKMPADCYVCPMETQKYYAHYIQLPMKITIGNTDTLSVEENFWVDMGIPEDIAALYLSEVWKHFEREDSSRTKCRVDNFGRFYKVNTTIFDHCALDSVRLYVHDNTYSVASKYLLGLNFLKRFNLFFDKKHKLLGLQPIKEYKRIDSGKTKRFEFSSRISDNLTWIVTKTGNYEENSVKIAGLREGDEITGINNVPFKIMSNKQYKEFTGKDTLTYNIIRAGQTMRIIVPKDKNEEQGD